MTTTLYDVNKWIVYTKAFRQAKLLSNEEPVIYIQTSGV